MGFAELPLLPGGVIRHEEESCYSPSPEEVDDALTAVLTGGAGADPARGGAEVAAQLASYGELRLVDGWCRVVGHGHGPEREIVTGIEPVAVRLPSTTGEPSERSRPSSMPVAVTLCAYGNPWTPRSTLAMRRSRWSIYRNQPNHPRESTFSRCCTISKRSLRR